MDRRDRGLIWVVNNKRLSAPAALLERHVGARTSIVCGAADDGGDRAGVHQERLRNGRGAFVRGRAAGILGHRWDCRGRLGRHAVHHVEH